METTRCYLKFCIKVETVLKKILVIECEISKDVDSKMFNGCTIILEVWTIWSPLEAV